MKSLPDHLRSVKEVLLYAYIWQIPFSWRIVFDPSRSRWSQSFNEYMDISLYIGEVLIAFALLTHILEYKIANKSIFIYLKENLYRLFHVEHRILYFTLGILLISMNLLLSIDPALSLVSALHIVSILGFMFLFLNVYVSRGTKFIQNVFFTLVISLILQLLIACIQVLSGTSIGLHFLNESKLSLETQNVAKSNIFSNTYLRAYGTFLHPNILSAYAVTVVVFLIYIEQSLLFHVKHHFQVFTLVISTATVLLSQSKVVLILLLLLLVWYFNEKFRLFHVEQLIKSIVIVILISIPSLALLNGDAKESFQTRVSQFSMQSVITPKEFLIGSGLGTYRLSYDQPMLDWWNYEPVHFVPMIILKELGFFICLGIVVCLSILIICVPRGTYTRIGVVGVFILYVALTDHYSWDIYQGTSFIALPLLLLYIDKNNNT